MRVSDPVALELRMVVNTHMCAGNICSLNSNKWS